MCGEQKTNLLDSLRGRGPQTFGHSFGGAQTLQFCADDAHCKAGIDIDGAPYGSEVQHGLKQAFHVPTQRPLRRDVRSRQPSDHAALHSIYDRLPNGRLFVNVRGAHHFSFSDQALLKSQLLMKVLASVAGFGKLDSRRGLAITTMYVHTFFDVYLKGAPANELTSVSARYLEVQLKAH